MKLGICTLGCIAKVSLGFKSLQNQFYYLSKEQIRHYNLKRKHLRPIFRLADLDTGKYNQSGPAKQWLFYCKEKEQDLRGTGALAYIRTMEKVPATEKKQTGRRQTIKQVLEAQNPGGFWYAPKAQPHEAHIWLRKAFNTVYSPFIFEHAAVVDQRCNYVIPTDGVDWKELAAFLTSSLFALSAESFGAASMGAGALELATEQIRDLKAVDLRSLKEDAYAKRELVELAESVWTSTKPINWEERGRPPQEVQALDKWLLARMGTAVTLDRLYSDLLRTMKSRLVVARDKDAQTQKHQQMDISSLGHSIAESVRPLLESCSFPDSFVEPGTSVQALDFSGPGTLEIESHPMMGQVALAVRDGAAVLFESQMQRSVAQVIIRALLLGRRKFSVPMDEVAATATLKAFHKWFPNVLDRISTACATSAVGTSYEDRVYQAALDALHLDPNLLEPEFFGTATIR